MILILTMTKKALQIGQKSLTNIQNSISFYLNLDAQSAQMSYLAEGFQNCAIEGYNSYLPSVMDFTLHDAFRAGFP